MPAPAAETTRAFPAASAQLGDIDAWIEDVGSRWGLTERTVFRARVCIAELAANAIEHGGASERSDPFSVTLRNRNPALEIEFTDPGRPFDPAGGPMPSKHPSDADDEGGRGLQLLRAYASALNYRRDGNSNVLTFRVVALPTG